MLQTPQTSMDQQDSEVKKINKATFTLSEILQQRIPSLHEIPKASKCKFCGKTVEPKGLVLYGKVFLWSEPRCTCPQTEKYWNDFDAKREAERKVEKERKRQEELSARIQTLLGKSGIKKRFMKRTFDAFIADTPERERSLNIAKRYVSTFDERKANGEGLYFEGTVGTGKTHLAAAISLALLNKGVPVICKTSNNLLLDVKKTFDYGEIGTEAQVLNLYKSVDLLVIDDLGKEQCSEWSVTTLYTIINDRYEDMKPTIITTNYDCDSLLAALTPKGCDDTKAAAIISRLKETSYVVTMAWNDYRIGGNR